MAVQDEPKFKNGTARPSYYRVREAQQKGEKMPTFDKAPGMVNCKCWYDMASNLHVEKCPAHGELILPGQPPRPPAASEERGLLQEVYDFFMGPNASGSFTCSCGDPEHCGMCHMRKKVERALQSVPSSPPTVSSGYLRELDRLGKGQQDIPAAEPSDAGQPCPNCGTEITVGYHSKAQGCWPANTHDALPALDKLRDLVARWRNPDWARAYMRDDRPSEFICADELQAVLAPAPRPAEKD